MILKIHPVKHRIPRTLRFSKKMLDELECDISQHVVFLLNLGGKLILSWVKNDDDRSLDFLFRKYKDDMVREPLVYFGENLGNEVY